MGSLRQVCPELPYGVGKKGWPSTVQDPLPEQWQVKRGVKRGLGMITKSVRDKKEGPLHICLKRSEL